MKTTTVLLVIILALGLTSCDGFRDKPQSSTNTMRIVSVSKQLTEMLFALGVQDKLVGVDLSSTYPPEAAKLPTVGYHRMLSAEGITSLNPTIVFHDGNIAPEAVITQLQKVGIPMKQFPQTKNIEEAKALMRDLGSMFHVEAKAEELCNKLDSDMAKAQEVRKKYTTTPKVLVIHFGRAINNYFVMGRKGNPSQMIEWAGGDNAIDAPEGMRPITPELIASAQPDVILATDFGFDRLGSAEKIKELPGISLTPAAKNNKIFRIEEHDLVYLGPRTGENVLLIADLIHK
ncbi:MAG: ABC transporter substrate-binding protein [bacterium]